MRLLLISTPYSGHVAPTFGMARALVRRGHDVDFLTGGRWRPTITEVGASLVACPENWRISEWIKHACRIALEVGGDYDGMVYDSLFFPGRVLGETLGIPTARYFPCVALNASLMQRSLETRSVMGIFRSRLVRRLWTRDICGNLIPGIKDWVDETVGYSPECNIVFVTEWFQPQPENFRPVQLLFGVPDCLETSTT